MTWEFVINGNKQLLQAYLELLGGVELTYNTKEVSVSECINEESITKI